MVFDKSAMIPRRYNNLFGCCLYILLISASFSRISWYSGDRKELFPSCFKKKDESSRIVINLYHQFLQSRQNLVLLGYFVVEFIFWTQQREDPFNRFIVQIPIDVDVDAATACLMRDGLFNDRDRGYGV